MTTKSTHEQSVICRLREFADACERGDYFVTEFAFNEVKAPPPDIKGGPVEPDGFELVLCGLITRGMEISVKRRKESEWNERSVKQ